MLVTIPRIEVSEIKLRASDHVQFRLGNQKARHEKKTQYGGNRKSGENHRRESYFLLIHA